VEKKKRIGILTGGGDCPGLNAVIRAVVKEATLHHNLEVIGIQDGFEGVIENRTRRLRYDDVAGIISIGGTILGTSNKANPYHQAARKNGKLIFEDVSGKAIANIQKLGLECLICVGGDGTLTIANQLREDGVRVVGIPKTIDNDLKGTDVTFGFDSAVFVATEGIDRLHTTAEAHHRAMIMEVMGRNAGWIALYAGLAGGGDIILIPEIPYDINIVAEKIKERSRKGRRFSIIVVSEGARSNQGSTVIQRVVKDSTDPVRYGGVGFVLGTQIEEITGIETRSVVLGHLQRGGTPTPFDRVLATRLGAKAVDMVANGDCGCMVGIRGNSLVEVPLKEVAGGQRLVTPDNPVLQAARAVGTCFGDTCSGE
jgi:phosphofructokinase-like protein